MNNIDHPVDDRKSDTPVVYVKYPGPYDVIYGRGRGAINHIGNIHFRNLVCKHKPRYFLAPRAKKTSVAAEVLEIWKNLGAPGRFLSRAKDDTDDNVKWKIVDDEIAVKKVNQCLRERTLHNSDNTGGGKTGNATAAIAAATDIQKRMLLSKKESCMKKRMISLASSVGTQRIDVGKKPKIRFETAEVDWDLNRIQQILRKSNMKAQQEALNQKNPTNVKALLCERSEAEKITNQILQASNISAQHKALFCEQLEARGLLRERSVTENDVTRILQEVDTKNNNSEQLKLFLRSRGTGANSLYLLDQNLDRLCQKKLEKITLNSKTPTLLEKELKRFALLGTPGVPEKEIQRLALISAPDTLSHQGALQEALLCEHLCGDINRIKTIDNNLTGLQSLVAEEQLQKELAVEQLRKRLLLSSLRENNTRLMPIHYLI